MKKVICLLLSLLMVTPMFACKNAPPAETDPTVYKVPAPLQYPDYTFDSQPDTIQLRLMAVQAMRDILRIQWYTETEIRYRKNGPVNKKEFVHTPYTPYAGLLYSTANTGIFQFFEYYDPATGCLRYPGTSDELKLELGSSCADALLWGWSSVCNSIKGGFYPVFMVPSNGYVVVGDYTYRQSILSYNEMPSYAIIENNPKEIIMDAYAKTLPADALVSTSDNHAMMVIETPVVVKLPDGSIDSTQSYLMIQDQRAGGSNSFQETIGDETIAYSGRLSAKYTFDQLYEKAYIPVTAAEFTGAAEYEKASVSVSSPQCNAINQLPDLIIESNYPLAVINIISIDQSGNKTILKKAMFGGADMHGVPRTYSLNRMENIEELTAPSGSKIRLEVVVSTGERFYPIEFTV